MDKKIASVGDVLGWCLFTVFVTVILVSIVWDATTVDTWKSCARDGGRYISTEHGGLRTVEFFPGRDSIVVQRKVSEAQDIWVTQ